VEAVRDDGCVDLVRVMPHVHEASFTPDASEPCEASTERRLDTLIGQVAIPPGVSVTRVAMCGRPAPGLLAHAARSRAGLIVTGAHGHGFLARAFLGSVTTTLPRAATCRVLTVPRDPLPSPAEVAGADVLTDGQGHDVAMRIAHGSGHTVPAFAP
jgi:nucleotide-binding universal stress UspA family protein